MPELIEARIEHFDDVYGLLRKLNDNITTKSRWKETFEDPFSTKEGNAGFILKDGNRVVGFFGGIYSKRLINGRFLRFCNTHSWVVEPEYSTKGLLLLNRFHKLDNFILTNFSASPGPYHIMKKLGWKEKSDASCIVMAHPLRRFLNKGSKAKNFYFNSDIVSLLNDQENEIYQSHKKFRLDFNVVINNIGHSFQVFKQVTYRPSAINRILPFGKVTFTLGRLYYVSSPEVFFNDRQYNIEVICKRQNWLGVILPTEYTERFGIKEFRPYMKKRPILYKAKDFDDKDLDLLFSEIFVLDLN